MALDFNRYQSPGVYTESIPGPQISVQTPTPTAVGIFGLSLGSQNDVESVKIPTDQIIPPGTEPGPVVTVDFRQKGIKKESIKVANAITGELFVPESDYVIVNTKHGDDNAPGTRDDSYAIKRVKEGAIKEGDTVSVSYTYVSDEIFQPRAFYTYSDVQDYYGTPFNDKGEIQSELTLAARFAFSNGASRVVCVAIDAADPKAPKLADYENALAKLEGDPDISVVVPATGMQQIQQSVLAHVKVQSQNNYERRAIVGRDGSTTPVSTQQLIADAQSFSSSRVILVAPAAIKFFVSELNKEIVIGGQFLAAALAGVSVSRSPADPLTRKQIVGFSDLVQGVHDGEKTTLSQNGVCVLEKTRRNELRVRHGVTTKVGSVLQREWSVVGQEDSMIFRVRAYLDSDGLVGTMINDLTLVNIKASANAALESLVRDGVIRDFQGLQVRQLQATPDVVEVKFEWQASMPLNYIVVKYSINTSSGDISASSLSN